MDQRRYVCSGALILCLLAGPTAVAQTTEGELRWRFFEREDNQVSLSYADSDATDNIAIMFTCKRGFGRAVVTADMSERLRHALADTMRADKSPYGQLVPGTRDDGLILIQASMSEMYGWQFSFDFHVDSMGFEQFKRTGIFQFKFGEILVRDELKSGLEDVAKFQHACRSK